MAASIFPNQALVDGVCCSSGDPGCCPAVWHFVGANDKPGMVAGHDEWDRIYRSQQASGQRVTDYKYTRYDWAPPPRQEAYSYMTGHAPYELAWPDPALQEWMLEQRCPGCTGPPTDPPSGPDRSWRRSVENPDSPPGQPGQPQPTQPPQRQQQQAGGHGGHGPEVKLPPATGAAQELLDAARLGDLDSLANLLAAGVSLAPYITGGETALHAAIRANQVAFARELLRQGVSLSAQTLEDKSRSPLHLAAHLGHTELVELLLAHGADVNAGEVGNWRPLHEVSHTGHLPIAKLLYGAGADVNAVATGGWTCMHQASGNGHPQVVQFLLDNGADLFAVEDQHQLGALHVATQMRKAEVIDLLLKRGIARDGTLDLSMASMGPEGAQVLAQVLKTNNVGKKLHTLKLNYNKISDVGVKALVDLMASDKLSQVTTVELAANGITATGAAALATVLDAQSITHLELSGNELGDAGIAALSPVLRVNTNLNLIGLHMNKITDVGASELASIIEQPMSALEYIGLNKNEISDAGATALAAALPNSFVNTLKLDNNLIGETGAVALARVYFGSNIQNSHSSPLQLQLQGNPGFQAAGQALGQWQQELLDLQKESTPVDVVMDDSK